LYSDFDALRFWRRVLREPSFFDIINAIAHDEIEQYQQQHYLLVCPVDLNNPTTLQDSNTSPTL
jgi:hypothetical protein